MRRKCVSGSTSPITWAHSGMPRWAQWIGEVLPLTHFLRIVRGIMLKGAGLAELLPELGALLTFVLVVSVVAIARYRQTLD